MADFLDEKRREISDRMKELQPLVDEYRRLEAAAAALDGVRSRSAAPPARKRGPGRPRSSTTATGTTRRRRGRPKGSGTRAKEALALVRSNPGITIPEMAKKIGIHQNYLYRVLPGLQKDGMVRKQGRGWHPTAKAA